jgi:hypothetical protein
MSKKLIVLALSLLLGCSAGILPVVSTALQSISKTAPAASAADAAPIPRLDYRVSLAPNQIWDGTIEYFKERGFTTVVLIAAEPAPYDKELQKIREMGMYPILDIEYVIWNGGVNKSTPITQYDAAFNTWKQAGWNHVATEGGRSGDFDTLHTYFAKITYFNCDKCGLWREGLWQDYYKNQHTTEMSWETYYPSEISSIQSGALWSYNNGVPQGITAGVWQKNNANLNYDTYKGLIDWSYANDVGFTHFNVFFGLGATLADYQHLGFDAIITKLQQAYPPKPTGNWPDITVTSVRQVPNPKNSIAWDITNLGSTGAFVAPYAVLHNDTAPLPGRLNGSSILSQTGSDGSASLVQEGGYSGIHLGAGESVSILSPPSVPAGTQGVAYNVYVSYNNSSSGWLYSQPLYTTVGAKPLPATFFGIFDYNNTDLALLGLLAAVVLVTIAIVSQLRRMRQK